MLNLPEGKSHKIPFNPIKPPFSYGFPPTMVIFLANPATHGRVAGWTGQTAAEVLTDVLSTTLSCSHLKSKLLCEAWLRFEGCRGVVILRTGMW